MLFPGLENGGQFINFSWKQVIALSEIDMEYFIFNHTTLNIPLFLFIKIFEEYIDLMGSDGWINLSDKFSQWRLTDTHSLVGSNKLVNIQTSPLNLLLDLQ